jgi:hypothetical protein
MFKNNKDIKTALFESSEYLAGLLARYASLEIHYRDIDTKDSGHLEDAIIGVYEAVLKYAAVVGKDLKTNVIRKSARSYRCNPY